MEKCTPLWRKAHFEVKMYKTHQLRAIFRNCDVEKVHAVVARSTFPSQNAQNTPCTDHFWRFRCRKSARRCGAKHISKSKCTKHTMYGPFLEVQMSKKCTPLWREAHFEVKMLKTPGVRTTFGSSDVEKVHAVVARSTFGSQNVKNTRGSDHFWRFRCRFASLHYTTLHYTTLHSTTLHYISLHSTTFHYTTLHYTTLHCTPFRYTSLHYTTLHYTTTTTTKLHTLHYTPLHYTTLHYTLITGSGSRFNNCRIYIGNGFKIITGYAMATCSPTTCRQQVDPLQRMPMGAFPQSSPLGEALPESLPHITNLKPKDFILHIRYFQ